MDKTTTASIRRLLVAIAALLADLAADLAPSATRRRSARVSSRQDAKKRPTTAREWGLRQVRIAAGELGVREQPAGSNDGTRVRDFQSATGAYRAPWCASFSAWVALKGGFPKAHLPRPAAWVPAWEAAARDPNNPYLSVVSRAHARAGDRVIYDWDGDQGDHIGIVTRNLGPAKGFIAVEGNAGDAVARKTRLFGRSTTFVRLHPRGHNET